ncbi:MAG: VanZ family protein [Clostridia bacterium]|nr:VanZ family protein [Clostridia bacterium]
MIKFFRVISIILTLAIMILIFSMSSQVAKVSNKTSGGLIEKVLNVVYPNFENLQTEEKENIISNFQYVVRKTAHFSIYFALGICVLMSIITYCNLRLYVRIVLSGIICIIYAASDELHQLYVAGRSCELFDVFIDAIGSILGILIGYFLYRLMLIYIRKKRRENNA